MKKILFILLFSCLYLQAEDILRVDEFEVSLFSKVSKSSVQVESSMIFEGRDVQEYDFKIIDALNVVIGSFYVENLLTSQGKEGLKKAIIEYTKNKYAIDIDHVYIQKLNIKQEASTQELIDAMKKEGCCN
ncbi:flagellar basal body-associated FliL family protein [Sulfurospirillum arcachonense]|uniref:flagellar basal body-associated FliL family protein n=1 Tax=Sulfurospirillum arcachonense TaxID=57666 RepID=UPI000468807C|nr:flagellar basal body-associated FliL family protein [Sulfurospirillum arcachonense]